MTQPHPDASREVDGHIAISQVATPLVGQIQQPRPAIPQAPSNNVSNLAIETSDPVDVSISAPAAYATEEKSRNASSSEGPSSKDDDKMEFPPYGTRSRNRSGPRPNYNDDVDTAFDSGLAVAKVEAPSSKHSTPSEPASARPRPTLEVVEATPQTQRPNSGFTAVNAPAQPARPGNGIVPNLTQSSVTASPATEPAPPRQKRKYVWKNGSRPSPSNKAAAKDVASARPDLNASADASSTPDPPPAKRRKTGDGLTNDGFGATAAVQHAGKRSSLHGSRINTRDSCVVTFEKSKGLLKDGKMHADDGTVYAVNDHAYLICEPPGDPYYLCRIMEFRRDDANDPKSPVTSIIVNWYYRPKDIGRFNTDPRFLFASMQSDESPINSLRGKCTILHRSRIQDLEEYRKQRDSFWFNQLYDRYIHRPYDMVPAEAVINVPKRVKKAIDDRWKFLVVEGSRLKELTSAVKSCKRCGDYCAPNDSVDCGVCRNTYHMACVRPPLSKKPSRGFAWSCGPCSRAQEKRLQARHTSILPDKGSEVEDDLPEEDEEAAGSITEDLKVVGTDKVGDPESHTQAEVAKAQMWPWRYLGIHCSVEDVLQYDDRAIYPRASSRLGARHQAIVTPWFGRPVELAPLSDLRKKYGKGGTSKKDTKLSKDALAALEKEKIERANRPKWLQDEPPGYIARGEDYEPSDPRCTAERLFMVPSDEEPSFKASNAVPASNERLCDEYMDRVRNLARDQGHARPCVASSRGSMAGQPQWIVPTNYLDRALNALYTNDFNVNLALKELQSIRGPKDFKDPIFTKEELKRFEDGVAKFGSELRLVRKHVKSRPQAEIVRFYYNWKKTERGLEIWGRHDARRGSRKRAETSWTEIADEEDDSAFDNAKSLLRKRRFECKFCLTRHSRQWRRAPAVAPGAIVLADPKSSSKDKSNQLVVALCQRCAFPWRRYAIRWEDPEESAKSLNAPGGRQWKRVHDEHMLREFVLANEAAGIPTTGMAASTAVAMGITLTVSLPDPAAKKKTAQERELAPTPSLAEQKKKVPVAPPPRPPTPPIIPCQPRMRIFPCAVCNEEDAVGPLITCTCCKLTVHHRCYAISEQASPVKWLCDTCLNDKNGLLSFNYNCILCTVADRQPEMVEQPKVSHKKKNDRDREKERLEKQLTDDMALRYRREQQTKGRPLFPREAVKRTASNNWMHVICAIWTPEIKFDEPRTLENAEGMGVAMVNPQRMDPLCKLCRVVGGTCVQCHNDKCTSVFHVGCAHAAGYRFGFDIKPVKSTQKNSGLTVALGSESGLMTAVIYCEEHEPTTTPILHGVHEQTESGMNALETFVSIYKQADKSLTGTARKANMLAQSTRVPPQSAQAVPVITSAGRRSSLLTNQGTSKGRRFSITSPTTESGALRNGFEASDESENCECCVCKTDTSFRWWPEPSHDLHTASSSMPNGVYGIRHEQLWSCHKCHIKREQGLELTPPPSVDDEHNLAVFQKDYFELTMAPTTPAQPPPATPQSAQPTQAQQLPQSLPHTQPQPQLQSQALPLVQQFLQPPPPGEQWSGEQTSPGASTPPVQDGALARWTQELWNSSITLLRPDGKRITYRGREFGTVDEHAGNSWRTFLRRAEGELGFDLQRHFIMSYERKRIADCAEFIAALAVLIKNSSGHATWTIEDIPPMSWQSVPPRNVFSPPPPQHLQGPPPYPYQQGPPPMPYTPHSGPPPHLHPTSRPGSAAAQPMYGPPQPPPTQHQTPPAQQTHLQRHPSVAPLTHVHPGSPPPSSGYTYPQSFAPTLPSQPQLDNIAPELHEVNGSGPRSGPGSGQSDAGTSRTSPTQPYAYAQSPQSRQSFEDGTSPRVSESNVGKSETPAAVAGPVQGQGEGPTQSQGHSQGGASSSSNLRHLMH